MSDFVSVTAPTYSTALVSWSLIDYGTGIEPNFSVTWDLLYGPYPNATIVWATNIGNSGTLTITGLSGNAEYEVKIRGNVHGNFGQGDSQHNYETQVFTPPPPPPPPNPPNPSGGSGTGNGGTGGGAGGSGSVADTPTGLVPDPESGCSELIVDWVVSDGNGGITISWTPSNSGGVTSQKIYRSLISGGPYTLLTTVGSGTTSYKDTTTQINTNYYYVITAVSANGESAYSSQITMADNVTSQKLYRSLTTGGPYTLLATFNDATTHTYEDTDAESKEGLINYYYVVTAINSTGEGPYSSELKTQTLGGNGDGNNLFWGSDSPSGGATNSTPTVTGDNPAIAETNMPVTGDDPKAPMTNPAVYGDDPTV